MSRAEIQVPRRWKIGDLCQQKYYGKYLIIGVVHGIFNAYDIINEHGHQFQLDSPDGFVTTTELTYTFSSFEQTKQDFQQGLFAPYFKAIHD